MNSQSLKNWQTENGYKIIRVLAGRSNVFLLTNGTKNILIDTSTKRKWKKLDKTLLELGIQNLEVLILTHSHFDHAANATQLKHKYKVAPIIHKNSLFPHYDEDVDLLIKSWGKLLKTNCRIFQPS